jgi:hypothetical protein
VDLLENCRRVRKLCLMEHDDAIATRGRSQVRVAMCDACK